MIQYFITLIITLLLGYILGRLSRPEDFLKKESALYLDKLKKTYKEVTEPQLTVGAIRRPTAEYLAEKKEEPVKQATKKAIKDTLDNIPELREAKERMVK